MDEIWFHVNHRMEVLQLWLYELSQLSGQVASEAEERLLQLLASQRLVTVRQTFSEIGSAVKAIGSEIALRASQVSDPEYVFSAVSNAIGLDFNRATLYAIGFGFTVGSSLGLVIGICLQTPKQPSVLMRAIATTSYDGTDSIALLEDALVPKLFRPDQVLVEVKFASIDPLDLRISQGYGRTIRSIINKYNWNCHNELPVILGRDGSGIVVEIGSNVTNLEIGTPVYFCTDPFSPGTLAEYVLLDSRDVSPMPPSLGFESAATLPHCGAMAWEAVVEKAQLSNRNAHTKRVFVHCASTGCGWMVVQICAAFGCEEVTATAANRSKAATKTQGATTVLSLETGELDKEISHRHQYDIVFNTVGPIARSFCADMCAPDGQIVDAFVRPLRSDGFGTFFSSFYSLWVRVTHGIFRRDCWRNSYAGPALNDLSRLVERRLVRPFPEKTFTAEDVESAIAATEVAAGRVLVRLEPRRKNGYYPPSRS
ncbi:Alcohol dehydrogenase GroES-like domain [Nesidiocoris tenuis]|uniref:Alcohol dehydrogenase GroES-like domain n=1 Tax=Nesidiocoris tenuis TaxID=355587 RepID=A0ABN7BHL8_9HEMI|nr:Alcohol dehydrogenase GroES-like domain [Nesidiocoris tenuis]